MSKSISRILFLTGSYPPDVCGVGDYTQCLFDAFALRGASEAEIHLFYKKDWRISLLWQYFREIRRLHPDVLYLQYPTEGYGYSILPQLLLGLFIGRRRVVNLHEFQRKSMKGKIAITLFYLFGCRIVYTNENDRAFANGFVPKLFHRPSTMIRIGSNIPFHKGSNDTYAMAYFGLIRPRKGIEDVVQVTSILRNAGFTKKIAFVGAIPNNYKDYAAPLLKQLKDLGVELHLNVPRDEAADLLASSRLFVLPLEDGISERNGSILAALGNGGVIVGRATNIPQGALEGCILYGNDAASIAKIVLTTTDAQIAQLRSASREFIESLSWSTLAGDHLCFLLGRTPTS